MAKKIILILFAAFILLVIPLFILGKVPVPDTLDDCLVTEGKVIDIVDAGSYDVRFILEDDNHIYYINRGLEYELVLDELKKHLIGEVLTFYYPEHYSPMDPTNNSRHLSQVNHNNKVIYSEIGSVISSIKYRD